MKKIEYTKIINFLLKDNIPFCRRGRLLYLTNNTRVLAFLLLNEAEFSEEPTKFKWNLFIPLDENPLLELKKKIKIEFPSVSLWDVIMIFPRYKLDGAVRY